LPSKQVDPKAPDAIIPDALELSVQVVKRNRPVTWLAVITIVLIGFLLLLPPDIRSVFWESLQAQSILVSMLLVFSLVAISLVWSTGQRLDAWVFLAINIRGSRPIWLDRIMSGFTQIGNGITSLGIALVLFLLGERLLSYEMMLGTLTLWLVVELVKFVVRRSRPFIRLTQARIVGNRARGRSFPSGHTSQAFFMAMLIVQYFHLSVWAAILLYSIALLVGITRMYVGAHYPRDVIAGAILGSAWGLLGVFINVTLP
jgi:membrane-associated phospholipid phosphatase